jgi:hypothetical protein
MHFFKNSEGYGPVSKTRAFGESNPLFLTRDPFFIVNMLILAKMENVTLMGIHKDLLALREEVAHIRLILDEEYELSDHIVRGIEESRRRPEKEFVSNEAMRAKFRA